VVKGRDPVLTYFRVTPEEWIIMQNWQNWIDKLLGDENEIMIDDRIRQAVIAGDADKVAQLFKMRDRADLEAGVKQIAELQNRIFEKDAERESMQRELEHLSEPVKVAAKAYASALQTLEQRHLDLAQLQARQGVIDLGLQSIHEEITELRNQLNEMMDRISKE
jgi:chromosome segregation ATPase